MCGLSGPGFPWNFLLCPTGPRSTQPRCLFLRAESGLEHVLVWPADGARLATLGSARTYPDSSDIAARSLDYRVNRGASGRWCS